MFIRRTNVCCTTKLSYEALNRQFLVGAVSGSLFFSVVLCRLILLVSWCVGLLALLIFLALICALKKKQMCLQMRWCRQANFFKANALIKHNTSKQISPITTIIKKLSWKCCGATILQTTFASPVIVNKTVKPIL